MGWYFSKSFLLLCELMYVKQARCLDVLCKEASIHAHFFGLKY
ncbi:hypothetical protein VCRA2117O376_10422 [Vibrio crassostreae]|nr:hypothetical protein VCRA2114O367_10307 [Vibrio crassostreae]CAK1870801.1 hypothetical protein VCRA2119O381_10077 [Vibrio crassostreae]CAK1871602.1 hypothetical protein VCRA2117O376_10422 [Vibrio crassostreae]CAK1873784.1 hypothetical protein VCRA2114O369_10421 [Vibrio crassostreae]CAK1877352.1 hypothetical protein VCRA2113O357_10421 [Vibrio crassostreae]